MDPSSSPASPTRQARPDVTTAVANHKLFSALIAHALACGQTQVFNMAISGAASNLRRAGNTSTHHILSHEEVVDPVTGYQPNVTWFHPGGR